MSEPLYKSELIVGEPLNTYAVSWEEQPAKWQSMIAEVQEAYLKQKVNKPRQLNETLETLKIIIITKNLFASDEINKIEALCFAVLNLDPLHQLFSDPQITEIFGNNLSSELMITHRQSGRCRTNLIFSGEFWESLKIRSEFDTGLPLNVNNPALKLGFQTELGQFRISMQVPPLSVLGPTLTIRRLPSTSITLSDLEEQGQLPSEVKNKLENALRSRQNIIIAGEPGSGKTTLANALLLHSDPNWRLIVLEDAREITLSPKKFPLLVQYSLPAVGISDRFTQRSNEIARLLHRSPDYVFLGEIQNKEDTKVAFEGFAAGIRGMATTHARNYQGLLNRWTYSHQLPMDLVQSIDLIVLTKKEFVASNVKLGISGLYEVNNTKHEVLYEDH